MFLYAGSSRTSVMTLRSSAMTLSGSAEKSTEILSVVTVKSRLWLATMVIWLLGIRFRVPSPPRTEVLRSDIDSTVPLMPATVTQSPTLY